MTERRRSVARRTLLTAALGFLQLKEQPREVAPLRRWLDSWTGLGTILDGMVRQGFDVALTRNGDAGWRALFFPSSFIHESRSGAAWGTTQWQEWAVVLHQYTTGGGKVVHARVQRVGETAVTEERAWGAHERVAVKRTGGDVR